MSPFDGETYVQGIDKERLTGQLRRVFDLMQDGQWRTLREIKDVAGGTDASCSARLRDLRKDKFGAFVVNRRRRGEASKGIHEYQLLVGEVWTPIRGGTKASILSPHSLSVLRDLYEKVRGDDRSAILRVIALTGRPV